MDMTEKAEKQKFSNIQPTREATFKKDREK